MTDGSHDSAPEREVAITRVFSSPRSLVFKAWTESERRTFEAGFDSMKKGFAGSLDQLAEYLAKI